MESTFQDRLENFLNTNNQTISIDQLTPDASTREYFRIEWNGSKAIACVYPQDALGESQFRSCLDVTGVFLSADLPVARVFASDAEKGIVIHEDFGDTILRDMLLASDEDRKDRLLNEAITLIARIQAATANAFALDSVASRLKFDEEKLVWELNFFKTHYFESLAKSPLAKLENAALEKEFLELARELETLAQVLCHRDFHAANLMVLGGELKIIDHQDARLGSTAYDLVSLLLDRITVLPTPEWLAEKRRYFLTERKKLGLEELDEHEYAREFRLQTVQRCLKAIGTFSFQSAFRGKTHFIQYIEPMFQIVLRACENLDRFPTLQQVIRMRASRER
jgi:aminoglycoside/choline kinase family phosphotransferase